MEFYNLRTRQKVDIPESKIKKTKMRRKTKSGEQIRYALIGEHEGQELFKFVNEATYSSLNVPEVDRKK